MVLPELVHLSFELREVNENRLLFVFEHLVALFAVARVTRHLRFLLVYAVLRSHNVRDVSMVGH